MQVKDYICQRCSREFDSPLLMEVNESLQDTITGWIANVFGKSVLSLNDVPFFSFFF